MSTRRVIAVPLAALLLLAGCDTLPLYTPNPAAPVQWRDVVTVDYERSSPGLGEGHRYQSDIGWANVNVYGGGRTNWQDGISDPMFDDHFRDILTGIQTLEKKGTYQEVRIEAVADETIAGTPVRHARLSYAVKEHAVESHLFLTALRGKLLKIRITLVQPVSASSQDEVGKFVAARIEQRKHDVDP